jgi:hypothetical protein
VARSRLAQEVTAYLRGYHVEVTRATRGKRAIEPWMWLNAPAHRSLSELVELADATECVPGSSGFGWADARAVIVDELVRQCRTDETALTTLQRRELVPLELELAGRDDVTAWSLAQLALDAIGRTSEV